MLHDHGRGELAAEDWRSPGQSPFWSARNGSGKSTIAEAVADACKISSHGGKAGTKYASTSSQTPLGAVLDAEFTSAGYRLLGGPRRKRIGFFLRAETLYDLARS
jgi:predicted ATPase